MPRSTTLVARAIAPFIFSGIISGILGGIFGGTFGGHCLAQASLVKDIHQGAVTSPSSIPGPFVQLGPWYYFSTEKHSKYGGELWRTLGRPHTTQLVKDIQPGVGGSNPEELTVFRGQIYFSADDGTGRTLFRSDGTAAGTQRVLDPNQIASPTGLTPFGTTLLFAGVSPLTGAELYRTDGTTQNTVLVKDIDPGGRSSMPYDFHVAGNVVLFAASQPGTGIELYRTDGTTSGTRMVRDLYPAPGASSIPSQFTSIGASVYFIAQGPGQSSDLWVTNATSASLVRSFPNAPAPLLSTRILGVHKGKLMMSARDTVFGQELWISDGTTNGTQLLADLERGAASSFPLGFASLSGSFFFTAGAQSRDLFVSDGTAVGTRRLGRVAIGNDRSLTVSGSRVYFVGDDGVTGGELWASDGTGAGTTLVRDLKPGASGSIPTSITALGTSAVLFAADDGLVGSEVFRSDGTAANTTLVIDLDPPPTPSTQSSFPREMTELRGLTYFTADDGLHGREAFRSDGTAAGTFLLADISPGSSHSLPSSFTTVGSTVYFTAGHAYNGGNRQLWRTDGTAAGTRRVTNTSFGTLGLDPACLVDFRGQLYFLGAAAGGYALYKSDGTATGTAIVKSFVGAHGAADQELVTNGDLLFFRGAEVATGAEPWVSDGTTAGTRIIADLMSGSLQSAPANFKIWRGNAWFCAHTGGGYAVFHTDGQAVRFLSVTGYAKGFVSVRDKMFFGASRKLWTSDGTPAGTSAIPNVSFEAPGELVQVDEAYVLFVGADSAHGLELWRSDGTVAGTGLLKDIWPGTGHSQPGRFFVTGSRFTYFRAEDGVTGTELWLTDGTRTGTTLVQDFAPGPQIGFNGEMALANGKLLFPAYNAVVGFELFALDPGASSHIDGPGCGLARSELRITDPVLGGSMGVIGRRAALPSIGIVLLGAVDANHLYLGRGCRSHVDLFQPVITIAFASNNERWGFPLQVPNLRTLAGARIGSQLWYLPTQSPLGLDLSNGVTLTLGR